MNGQTPGIATESLPNAAFIVDDGVLDAGAGAVDGIVTDTVGAGDTAGGDFNLAFVS